MSKRPSIRIPFTTGFYEASSPQQSIQSCINWYVEAAQANTLADEYLAPSAGMGITTEAPNVLPGTSPEINRGGWVIGSTPYFVNGESLYRLEANDTLTRIGDIPGEGRAILTSSAQQLVIVQPDGGQDFIYTEASDELVELTSSSSPVANYYSADFVVFINGFFVFLREDSRTLFHSNLFNGLTYSAGDTANVEVEPDKVVGLHVYNSTLYALGANKIQPYRGTDSTNFAFSAVANSAIDYGLRTRTAITSFYNSFVFLAKDQGGGLSVVRIGAAYGVTRISTSALDFQISKENEAVIDNSFMLNYSLSGAYFVVLTIGDRTYEYNDFSSATSGRKLWNQRQSEINGVITQWRVNSIVFAYNNLQCGDNVDGRIGYMSEALGNEYGVPMKREVTLKNFQNNGQKIKISSIEVSCDAGRGDYDFGLDYSEDSYTFKGARYVKAGEPGEFGRRCIFRKLGITRKSIVPKLLFSGDYPIHVNNVEAVVS